MGRPWREEYKVGIYHIIEEEISKSTFFNKSAISIIYFIEYFKSLESGGG